MDGTDAYRRVVRAQRQLADARRILPHAEAALARAREEIRLGDDFWGPVVADMGEAVRLLRLIAGGD